MTMDRERALRKIRAAEDAKAALDKQVGGASLQGAWEDWTIAWRIAADLVEGYGKRNLTIGDALKDLKAAREADDVLWYLWQCGNAERHSPDGSADRSRAWALRAADQNQPLRISNLTIGNGRISFSAAQNAAFDPDAGTLIFRKFEASRGARAAEPPPDADHRSLSAAGEKYLKALESLVFPTIG